jgi:hypothetical protein
MTDDRLPLRAVFGRIGGRPPRGRPPKTWINYVREDFVHLSGLHGGVRKIHELVVQCKDRQSWTIAIHKLKQINNRCRTGAVWAAVHVHTWSVKCPIINRFGGAGETDG